MSHPCLGDPAYLTSLLNEWGAPAAVQAALTAGGFTTLASIAFAVDPDADEAPSIRALIRVTDDPLPVNPVVANARQKLRELRLRLLLPTRRKGLLWVPWRLRSSEADALHWQEARRPRTDKQLLSLLLPDEDNVGPSASVSLSGPAEPTLRRMLAILAMLGEAHLLVVRRFNERFLAYALAQHHDTTLRGPTLQEILNADKSIWSRISGLVRDHSWSLTDAMNEVGFYRQDISALLQPRPKAATPITLASDQSLSALPRLTGRTLLAVIRRRKPKKTLTTRRSRLLLRRTTNPGSRRLRARRSA